MKPISFNAASGLSFSRRKKREIPDPVAPQKGEVHLHEQVEDFGKDFSRNIDTSSRGAREVGEQVIRPMLSRESNCAREYDR
jgi:hypothetical protein